MFLNHFFRYNLKLNQYCEDLNMSREDLGISKCLKRQGSIRSVCIRRVVLNEKINVLLTCFSFLFFFLFIDAAIIFFFFLGGGGTQSQHSHLLRLTSRWEKII